jgi:hypothetical protein
MGRFKTPDPIRYCVQCGALLTRKKSNGRWEPLQGFIQRKYCSQACMSQAYIARHMQKSMPS